MEENCFVPQMFLGAAFKGTKTQRWVPIKLPGLIINMYSFLEDVKCWLEGERSS